MTKDYAKVNQGIYSTVYNNIAITSVVLSDHGIRLKEDTSMSTQVQRSVDDEIALHIHATLKEEILNVHR